MKYCSKVTQQGSISLMMSLISFCSMAVPVHIPLYPIPMKIILYPR